MCAAVLLHVYMLLGSAHGKQWSWPENIQADHAKYAAHYMVTCTERLGEASISLCCLCRLPERQSKCELEVDACVEDILNRQEVPNHTCHYQQAYQLWLP